MVKKYYFLSVMRNLVYIFIVLFLIACFVLCFFVDEIHSGVVFVMIFLSISIVLISIWIGFSFTFRIQIDYDKKELYIKQPFYMKRIKFEDVVSIQIIDYNEVAFDFILTTKIATTKMAYTRYYRKKPTGKIITKLNELKTDLMNISNKTY